MTKKFALFFLIITAFWFLFTFRLTDVPPGINGDEAAIGYNAALISQTGKDARGNFLPLFTSMPESFDWKQPVTVYATALAFKIFGSSYFVLRAVSVFFTLISALLIYLLINRVMGFKKAILGLLIFAVIPAVMIQSHLALENIAPLPFISFWLLMLYQYSTNRKTKYLIFSAVSLGFALFSYLGLRLIIPVLAITSLGFLGKSLKKWLIFVTCILPFFLLLLLARNQYPGSALGVFKSYQISSYQDLILPYISSFDPSFLFLSGDTTPYHSTGKHGVFLLATLPLFILGIIRIIQKRNRFLVFVLATFFLVPLFFGLGSTVHRGSRLLVLVPLFVVIATVGFAQMRKIFAAAIIFLIILNFGDFLNDYWYHYPRRVKQEFAAPLHKAFASLKKLSEDSNLKPHIQEDLPLQNPTAFLFFEQAYFPDKLERWRGDGLPEGKAVIFVDSTGLAAFKSTKMKVEKIARTDYALVTNEKN